jgi:predicted outer membrane repeat protein
MKHSRRLHGLNLNWLFATVICFDAGGGMAAVVHAQCPGQCAPGACSAPTPHGTCAEVGVGCGSNPQGCWFYQHWDSAEEFAQLVNIGHSQQNVCGGQNFSFSGSATATASYGLLTQWLNVSVVHASGSSTVYQALANTRWRDHLVAIGAPGSGTVRFTFDFAANVSGGTFTPAVNITAGGTTLALGAHASAVYILDRPVTFGVPFDMEVRMFKWHDQGTVGLQLGQCASLSAEADFTLQLIGVEVFDSSGLPVPNAIVRGTSGTQYLGAIPMDGPRRAIPSDDPLTHRLGESWADATSLWWAMELTKLPALQIEDIWLKEGTYLPVPLFGNDRSASIRPVSNTTLYGGFAGWETSLDQRDLEANHTIFSGDLNGNGVADGSDSYHVVRINPGITSAAIDGVTIRSGYANGTGLHSRGGGVVFATDYGTPLANASFTRCKFVDNHTLSGSSGYGGAVSIRSRSSASFQLCVFEENTATGNGGGIGVANFTGEPPGYIISVNACVFVSNSGSGGGAIRTDQTAPMIVDSCTFMDNQAGSGGAILAPQLILHDSIFINNVATSTHPSAGGGAIGAGGIAATIEDCHFEGNSVTATTTGIMGGAIRFGAGPFTVRRSTFIANACGHHGGAIGGSPFNGVIEESEFVGNSAGGGEGGAIYMSGGSGVIKASVFEGNVVGGGRGEAVRLIGVGARMIGCVFTAHSGGGAVSTHAGARVDNCLFVGNNVALRNWNQFGPGMFHVNQSVFVGNGIAIAPNAGAGSKVTNSSFAANGWAFARLDGSSQAVDVYNCILYGNTLGSFDPVVQGSPNVKVYHSNIEGGWSGDGFGNIDADPMFVSLPDAGPDGVWGTDDDDLGDLRLLAGSPCIDTGLNDAVPPDVFDVDGDGDTSEPVPLDFAGMPRFVDGLGDDEIIVDMGAYEFQGTTIPGDLNGDGVVNVADLLLMFDQWGDCDDCTPGACTADLNEDCVVNVADLLILFNNWS